MSFTTILLRVILGRPMFMTAETPTRIPAFYSPEPLAGTQDTLWTNVTGNRASNLLREVFYDSNRQRFVLVMTAKGYRGRKAVPDSPLFVL
jgi:hypothetical protein